MGNRGVQGNKSEYKGIQGNTREYRGKQGSTRETVKKGPLAQTVAK